MSKTFVNVTLPGTNQVVAVPVYSCDLSGASIDQTINPLIKVHRLLSVQHPDGSEQFFGELNEAGGFIAYVCPEKFQSKEVQFTSDKDLYNLMDKIRGKASLYPQGSPWNQPLEVVGINPTAPVHGAVEQAVKVSGVSISTSVTFTLTDPSGTVTAVPVDKVQAVPQGVGTTPYSTVSLGISLPTSGTWKLGASLNSGAYKALDFSFTVS